MWVWVCFIPSCCQDLIMETKEPLSILIMKLKITVLCDEIRSYVLTLSSSQTLRLNCRCGRILFLQELSQCWGVMMVCPCLQKDGVGHHRLPK